RRLRDHRHGQAPPRSPRPHARQRPVHPTRRTGLPPGISVRDLRLLPHRHRVPAHPHPSARPRPRQRPGRPGRPVPEAHPARSDETALTLTPHITLNPAAAPDLAETLPFTAHWLSGSQQPALARSLATFVGPPAYGIETLRADLHRF